MERYILKRTQSNASFLIFYKIFDIIYIENEKRGKKMKDREYTKYIKTTDNWYGNYPGDRVQVRVFRTEWQSGGEIQSYSSLQVWGNDDFALVLEKGYDDFSELVELYNKMPEPVTKDWCIEHGFKVF